jgi:hypothetical protein
MPQKHVPERVCEFESRRAYRDLGSVGMGYRYITFLS